MRAPNMIADSMSRPWSSVPSGNSALPPSALHDRRQRARRAGQRREVERIVRRDPRCASSAAHEQIASDQRSPRRWRTGESGGSCRRDVAVTRTERESCIRGTVGERRRGCPPPGRPDFAEGVTAVRTTSVDLRSTCRKYEVVGQLDDGRHSSSSPQASACWCSGMWPKSSWWSLEGLADHRCALRLVGLRRAICLRQLVDLRCCCSCRG